MEYFLDPNVLPGQNFTSFRTTGRSSQTDFARDHRCGAFSVDPNSIFFVTGDRGESPTPHPLYVASRLYVALHPVSAPRDPSWKGLGL